MNEFIRSKKVELLIQQLKNNKLVLDCLIDKINKGMVITDYSQFKWQAVEISSQIYKTLLDCGEAQ